MTTTTTQLGKVLRAQGDNLLGAIVMWSLGGFLVDRQALRDYFTSLGLEAAVGNTPGPAALASAAVAEARIGQRDHLIREVGEDADKVLFAVVAETRDTAAGKVEHAQTCRIAVDKKSGDIALEDEANLVAHEVRTRYLRRKQYAQTDEVSTCVVRALMGTGKDRMLGGLRLAGRGGSYFVLPSELTRLRAMAAWLHDNGKGSLVTILEITGSATNLEAAAANARASIVGELRGVLRETRAYVAELEARGDESVPDRVVETRIRRVQALEERAALYADVLGDLAADVKATITDAMALVTGIRGATKDSYGMTTGGITRMLEAGDAGDTEDEGLFD